MFYMKLLKLFAKDVRSCLRGAGKNMIGSPASTTKVFMAASPASVAILAADASFGCGREIKQRRYIEKQACEALHNKNFKKVDNLSLIYKYQGHGDRRRMLNTCPR